MKNKVNEHVGPEPLSYDDVVADLVSASDVRISPEQLRHQAHVARGHDNPQLGENLERAAELTRLSDADLLAVYEALRPFRSSAAELLRLAERLDVDAGPLCGELVREALHQYERRDLLRRAESP